MAITLLIMAEGLLACTLFWANRNDEILCAKNMDWSNTNAAMLVLPAEEGVYGRVYFGVQGDWGFTNTSAMNEKGLWYGGASLPHREVSNTYDKPRVQGEIIEKIMRECETVEEAIELYSTYWEPHWDGHTMLADRFGNCVVVEYGEDDVVFIRNSTDKMVATNFYLIDTLNARWTNCYRYEVAELMLGDSTAISYDLFRQIADATHAEGVGPTGLTTIHDLRQRQTRVFRMFNYEEYIDMDLSAQLNYGHHYVGLADYFNGIRRLSPFDGEDVPANHIELSWAGDGDDYVIRYGSDPELKSYTQIEYHGEPDVQEAGTDWKIIIFPLFSMMFVVLKRKKTWLVMIIILSGIFSSCYRFEQEQFSTRIHQIIIEDQIPGTQLYWKVLSTGNDYNSETIIFSSKVVANEE